MLGGLTRLGSFQVDSDVQNGFCNDGSTRESLGLGWCGAHVLSSPCRPCPTNHAAPWVPPGAGGGGEPVLPLPVVWGRPAAPSPPFLGAVANLAQG